MIKTYLNWSSGKDAAYTLHKLQQDKSVVVDQLLTTINTSYDRVSMHGLRKSLLLKQTEAIDLSLKIIELNGNVSMTTYSDIMLSAVKTLENDGYKQSAFGDIFLEDLRDYRIQQFSQCSITPVFPLWKMNTQQLAKDIINSGIKAIVVCVNAKVLDQSFCGRLYDFSFLRDLPKSVDPCGENGEFHTFVFDGPMFKNPFSFNKGEYVRRSYKPTSSHDDCHKENTSWDTDFWYLDLLPN